MIKIIRIIPIIVVLTACSSGADMDGLRIELEALKVKKPQSIKPLPVYKAYEAFAYGAHSARAPFEMPIKLDLVEGVKKTKARSSILPDFNRPKEPLEEYSIDSLQMVGTIQMETGDRWAFVQDVDGNVHRIKAGYYIGRNFGQITEISEARISINEIVPDGQGGWVERPRLMLLNNEN